MGTKEDFLPFAKDLLEEFGFKLYKTKYSAIQKFNNFEFEMIFGGDGNRSVRFNCLVKHKQFSEIDKELTGSTYWGDALIRLLTSHAFPNRKNKPYDKYYGELFFKQYYGDFHKALTYEQAKNEFERLFTEFLLPWFEKHKTFAGIRHTYRNAPEKFKTWYNTEYTHAEAHTNAGDIFQMFFVDALISRLLGDDMRPVEEIYEELYKDAYEKKWNKIDSETGKPLKQVERIKRHFDILPRIMENINAVTPTQWEEYRKKVGLK